MTTEDERREDFARAYQTETTWLAYHDKEQEVVDHEAAEEEPGVLSRIGTAAAAGAAATVDETATTFLHDVPQLFGAQGTGEVDAVASVIGLDDYEPKGLLEQTTFDLVNLGLAYFPGTWLLKGAGLGVKGAKALKGMRRGEGDAPDDKTPERPEQPARQRKDEELTDKERAEVDRLEDERAQLEASGGDEDLLVDIDDRLTEIRRAPAAAASGGATAGSAASGGATAGRKTVQRIAREAGAMAIGGFVARDPFAERYLLVKESSPAMRELVEEWEESPDPEHPRWEGRFLNAAEEGLLGAAGAAAAPFVKKAYQWMKKGIADRRAGKAELSPAVRQSAEGQAVESAVRREVQESRAEVERVLRDQAADGPESVPEPPRLGADFGGAPGGRAREETMQWRNEQAQARRVQRTADPDSVGKPLERPAKATEGRVSAMQRQRQQLLRQIQFIKERPMTATRKAALERAEASVARLDKGLAEAGGGTLPVEGLEAVAGALTEGRHLRKQGARAEGLLQSLAGEFDAQFFPYRAARVAAQRVHQLAQATGNGALGQVELRNLQQRLKEWGALQARKAPGSVDDVFRAAGAHKALLAYSRVVGNALQGKPLPEGATLGTTRDALDLWEATLAKNPLYEAHMPSMERGKYASRRVQGAAQARSESLLGTRVDATGKKLETDTELNMFDNAVWRQNVALHDGIVVDADYAGGSAWGKEWTDRPVDVYFEDIRSTADFSGAVEAVAGQIGEVKRPGGRAAASESLDGVLRAAHGRPPGITEPRYIGRPEAYPGQHADILDTLTAMANTVRTLGRIAAGKSSTPDQRASFIRAAQKFDGYIHWARGDEDAAAAALRGAADTTLEGLDEVARRIGVSDVLRHEGDTYATAMAGIVGNSGNLHGVVGLVTRWRKSQMGAVQRGLAKGDKHIAKPAREVWINSVLSSPATHARNVLGNAIMPVLQIPENFIAGALEGDITQGARESASAIQGLLSGVGEAWRLARLDFKHQMAGMRGDDTALGLIEEQTREMGMETARRQMVQQLKRDDIIDARATGLPKVLLDRLSRNGGWMANVAAKLDVGVRQAINAPTALLRSEDVFFKTLTYRMEVNRLATREAYREGLRGEAMAARVATLLDETVSTDGRGLTAMKQAHINTFTNEMGAFGEMSLAQLNRIPGARYVVPFFRTPWNIVARSLEYTPGVAKYVGRSKQDWALGGRSRKQMQARQAVGGMLALGATGLVLNGKMTGGNVHNPDLKWDLRKLGRQPYSVKVGDTWVDYRFVGGPVGISVGMVTDAITAVHAASTDDEMDKAVALWHTATGIAGSLLGDTWMGDVGEFYELVSRGDFKALERWTTRTGSGFVPLHGLQDDVRETISLALGIGQRQATKGRGGLAGEGEPTSEMVFEAWQSLYRKAIGPFRLIGEQARDMPVRDVYGAPIKPAQTGWLSGPLAIGQQYSGLAMLQERTDPLSKELLRLAPPGVLSVPQTFGVSGPTGESRRLEPNPEQYDFFSKRRGELLLRYGTADVGSAGYQNGTDTAKVARLIEAGNKATAQAVNETYAKFPELRNRRMQALNGMNQRFWEG